MHAFLLYATKLLSLETKIWIKIKRLLVNYSESNLSKTKQLKLEFSKFLSQPGKVNGKDISLVYSNLERKGFC